MAYAGRSRSRSAALLQGSGVFDAQGQERCQDGQVYDEGDVFWVRVYELRPFRLWLSFGRTKISTRI